MYDAIAGEWSADPCSNVTAQKCTMAAARGAKLAQHGLNLDYCEGKSSSSSGSSSGSRDSSAYEAGGTLLIIIPGVGR